MMQRSHHIPIYHLLAALVLATLMAPQIDAFTHPPSLQLITTSHLKSTQSDLSSNVKELELLRRERNTQRGEHERERTKEEQDATFQETQQQSNNQKNSIKTILSLPVGDLTQRDLIGLCNSIRHVPAEKSSWSLRILERILTEVERWEDAQRFDKRTFVKKIHIFSVLTALTKNSQSRKSQRRRYSSGRKRKYQGNQQQYLDSKDVDRLKNVVFLLKRLCRDKRSPYCNSDCYQKDVLSFSTMIAAESSMTEEAAVNVALEFIDEMEKEIDAWDPRIIGSVLNALAHWGRAEEAHVLLSRAMGCNLPTDLSDSSNESAKSGSNIKCLDPKDASPCYDSLLRAYAKYASLRRGRPRKKNSKQFLSNKKALARARYILLNHMPEVGVQITNHTCNAVLSGYSALEMGTEAEKLLQEIETMLSLSSSQPSALDTACYNSVLHGYSRERNGVTSAERLFTAMKEQTSLHEGTSNTQMLPPKPDMITYASMLNCYSINRMGAEAYSLVQQIERPTSACYLSAIRALERSNDPTSPDKVLSLIGHIEQNSSGSGKGPTTVLNRRLFNVAMQCMIKRGEGAKAEELLDKYLNSNSSREQNNDVQPYILALRAYENTKPVHRRKEAAESAETLFQKIKSLENNAQKLEAGAYNVLLNCFARAGMSSAAEKLLEEFEPTPESYGFVIKAISLSDEKDGVERAWNILHQLGYPRKNAKDVEPFHVPITTFNSMLKLFARRGMATEAEALLHSIDEFILEGKLKESGPNTRSYEAVLEALGKASDSDAVERAEALVTRIEVMSELGGGQQPSLKLYNTLLACYANAGKVGSAERLLSRLHEQSLKPDAFSYGATIKALKNSGKSKDIAIARVKELSQSLERNGGVGNEIIFAHRLSILAKFGLAQQAENLLKEMEEKHKLGDLKQGPGIIHHTAVLNAWSKTDDKKAVARAESLFQRMKDDPNLDLDLAAYHGLLLNYAVRGMSKKARRLLQVILDSDSLLPNRNTFTMVIDSYSRASSNTNNPGLKAEELLDQMRELQAAGNSDVEPDSVCYASVIRAKQASKSSAATISDLSEFDKVQLMRELQIERWPFQ